MKSLTVLTALCLAGAACAAPAFAGAGVTLPLSGDKAEITLTRYSCNKGEPFDVQYVNVGANNLAVLTLDGQETVFVNVIAASGARYVAGAMEFWTKGDTASFTDVMKDDGAAQDCVLVP